MFDQFIGNIKRRGQRRERIKERYTRTEGRETIIYSRRLIWFQKRNRLPKVWKLKIKRSSYGWLEFL